MTPPSAYAYAPTYGPDAQSGDGCAYAGTPARARVQEGKSRAVGYRYGFNGKEDDDITGWQDYGERNYLPSIARFASVDSLAHRYPMLTPYQFASNRPIDGVYLEGAEYVDSKLQFEMEGRTIYITGELEIKARVVNLSSTPLTKVDLTSEVNLTNIQEDDFVVVVVVVDDVTTELRDAGRTLNAVGLAQPIGDIFVIERSELPVSGRGGSNTLTNESGHAAFGLPDAKVEDGGRPGHLMSYANPRGDRLSNADYRTLIGNLVYSREVRLFTTQNLPRDERKSTKRETIEFVDEATQ